ncbi:MAG: esterase family protein [Bacteroidia bacterium]|jgi:enterochelin esterase-like enzyme|nr:esterase family protein [Bacteroidia bacterium]
MSLPEKKNNRRKEEKSTEPKKILRSVFIEDFYSAALRHRVKMEILLPPWYEETPQFNFRLLILNDGQSMMKVKIKEALLELYKENKIPPLIVCGVHAHNRLQEYGVSGVPDYKSRGDKALKYSRFVVNELLPLLKKNFRVAEGAASTAIAGFSLGGLSAFDIAWNYPHIFGTAGVFSGSFWWRSKGYNEGYDDTADRIMHRIVRSTDSKSNQRFWFQCGTEDEMSDRNNNGIIDAIEDTLDVIAELEQLGYERGKDVEYVEVQGGRHHEDTWAEVMPQFLEWAFAPRLQML